MRIDGHDMTQVVDALQQAKAVTGRPVVILANTVKGKGVSFMEDQAGWHGKTPNCEELTKGLRGTGADRSDSGAAFAGQSEQITRQK